MHVDFHAKQRVNQRNRVRAAGFGRPCHLCNIRHIGRELDNQRNFGHRLDLLRDMLNHLRICAKRHAALFDVGAGDVEFKHIHAIPQNLRDCNIVLNGGAAKICNQLGIKRSEPRKLLFQKRRCTGILQSDTV